MTLQNRCSQHNQQIVALCIDKNCTQQVKAVCPLQLYNDHLDHTFQNIAKIHSDWAVYQKDCQEIKSNVFEEAMLRFMDGILDELMFKIKQHLFLLRKQLQTKMSVYYTGSAVVKIQTALTGITKCLNSQFLDLRHSEIQNARFFTQIYGMKKLLNDTSKQRESFQKDILIAFAKIKQEMFMDYPKFNALVKAKQYEYCEIIKNQKIEIDVQASKLSQIGSTFDRIVDQHKQLTYEVNRMSNELRTKESQLAETTEKLVVITKKYNEQAQEAIMKAREIKTKNILGIYASKHLYRINDRTLKTGDSVMDWPHFADIGSAKGKIYVKINRAEVGAWVLLGVMFRDAVERNQYEFDNYKNVGHGTYLMDGNRWCYSDSDEDFNCRPLGFQFSTGDVIKVQVFDRVIRFSKMAFGWEEEKFQLPYNRRENDEMLFCIAVKGEHTQVQMV